MCLSGVSDGTPESPATCDARAGEAPRGALRPHNQDELRSLPFSAKEWLRRTAALLGARTAFDEVLPPLPASCADRDAQCERWAAQGECRKNAAFMSSACCASCTGSAGGAREAGAHDEL